MPRKSSRNSHISSIFGTEHFSRSTLFYSRYQPNVIKHVIKDGHIFLRTKQWFGSALPKAMKTCFKAILLIITHTVGGICDNSPRKFKAKDDGRSQLIFVFAAKVDTMS